MTCHQKIAGNWIQNGRMGKEIDGRTRKNEDDPSKNRPKLAPKRGKTRKKWASQGKKWERLLEKSPEIGFRMEKSKKNGAFGAKNMGWGRGEKMGLTADFAML